MKNKHIILYISLLANCFYGYTMEPKDDIQTNEQEFIQRPIEYANFMLTRPYGKSFKSNFDYLSEDILENHIQPLLANAILIKYKHALLNHNYQNNKDRNNQKVLNLIALGLQKEKTFQHYNGTYSIVPDIGYNYAMWDETRINKKYFYIQNIALECPDEYMQLLCSTKQKNIDLAVFFPQEQILDNNKTHFAIISKNKTIDNYSSKSIITHHILSNDHKWLIMGLKKKNYSNITLFNLHSEKEEYVYKIKGSIGTLCTAHKLPLFVACNTDGSCIKLINLSSQESTKFKMKNFVNHTEINAGFNPNDKQFIIYGGTNITLFIFNQTNTNKKDIYPKNWHPITINTKKPIRKVSFTPDGKLILLAMCDGSLYFKESLTYKSIRKYHSTWHSKHEANVDDQVPLLLYSIKNKLLFSLNPTSYATASIATFVIRKLTNGRMLTAYKFYLRSPKAMGLTEDEQSIILVYHDDTVSLLHIYNDQDIQDINYIQQKTNFYQLSELGQICKKFKTEQTIYSQKNTNASPLVRAIRNYLEKARDNGNKQCAI